MDARLLFGLGVSALTLFGRYLFPSVPKPMAAAGFSMGAAFVVLAFAPWIRTGPALAGTAGLALLVAALVWQLQSPKPQPQVSSAAPSNAAPSSALHIPAVQASVPARVPERDALMVNSVTAEDLLRPHVRQPSAIEIKPIPPEDILPPKPQATSVERSYTLRQLTQLYIASHDGITPRMISGLELPPVDFLNAELEREGARWRVRSANGPNAQTYDLEP